MAFNKVDRLTLFLAAMPDKVSPDFTLYVPPLDEADDFELFEGAADDDEPESFNDCPG
ncbi:hypothetical protein GCM10022249_09600 [Enteractinococcus coprophilus]